MRKKALKSTAFSLHVENKSAKSLKKEQKCKPDITKTGYISVLFTYSRQQ